MEKKLGEYTLNEIAAEFKKNCSENQLRAYIPCDLCNAILSITDKEIFEKQVEMPVDYQEINRGMVRECNYWKAQAEQLKKEIAELKLQLEKKDEPENYFDYCTKKHTIDCFKIKTGEQCDLFGTDCPNEFYDRQEKGTLKVD